MTSLSETDRVAIGQLSVDRAWRDFIEQEALPGTGVASADFWRGLEHLIAELAPRNRDLLATRDVLQERLDQWHQQHPGQPDPRVYTQMLKEIGYRVPVPPSFTLATHRVDPEVGEVAAPQLVVPITNARYALNAANARWGSLYDALHGTDALPEDGGAERSATYNPVRGQRVIAYVREFLDQTFALREGSHRDATAYALRDGALVIRLADGAQTGLADPDQFAGIAGDADQPEAVLLRHHGLHVHLTIDRDHPIGRDDPAGIADVHLEAALTTILDLEDSVACVDAEDKVHAYRHWLGLMRGDLTATVRKGGETYERRLAAPRHYRD
ncbi:MAG: malate synthase G, partial [Pseudomonadota bacterium]